MTQKTSLNKTPFNIFVFTLKKNLGFSLVAAILAVMISPVYLYSVITNYVEDYSKLIYNYDNLFLSFAVIMAVAVMAFFMVLLYINFSYLYNKSASDYFHALPLKRSSLLFARFSGGFVAALIPLTVGYIGAYALSFLDIVSSNRTAIVEAYIFTVLMMLMLGLFTLLFIITAGGVFDSILSLLAVNIGIPIIVAFVYTLCEQHLYGFTYSANYDTNILSYTTPFGYALVRLLMGLGGVEQSMFTPIHIFGIIDAIALFGALDVIAYNRRKSEKVGGSYAFKAIPEIIGFIIASLGLFVMGSIFGEEPSEIPFWIAGIVGACLAAVIYSLIINRGFKKVKRAIIVGVAASIVLIITNFGIMFDIFGWKYNLPTADEIESVTIQSSATVIDVKNIDLAVEFNETIVKEHTENPLDRSNRFTFEYTLKNGKTVRRQYEVETEIAKDLKARLIGEEYSKQLLEQFNEFKEKDVEAWELNGYVYESGKYLGNFDITVSQEKAEELVKAYCEDLKTYGNKYFVNHTTYADGSLHIYGRVLIKEDVEILADGTERYYSDYEDFTVNIENYETFKNVMAVLDTIEYELDTTNAEKY